jgi:spore maturation protein CgeB
MLFAASLYHPEQLETPPSSSDDPLFPPSQEHHFWVKALRRLGHECAVFWRSRPARTAEAGHRVMTERLTLRRALHGAVAVVPELDPGVRMRNRRLLRQASSFRPDVVIVPGNNRVVLPATLARLKREHGAAVVYACGDAPEVFAHRIERAAAPLYDLVVANDMQHAEGWRRLGARRVQVLPTCAIDPLVHRPYALADAERARYACEVGFVGTLVPNRLYARRVAALEALREFDLAIWSVHEVPPSLRRFHRGPLLGVEMLRALSATAIAPNPMGDTMRDGANMRLFEICGAGVLQLTDARPALSCWLRPGEHLAAYRDLDELRALVRQYLAHPEDRRRMAEAGMAHVRAHHTYDQRMAALIQLLEDQRAGSHP